MPPPKRTEQEKSTELLRLTLERTGIMDTLTHLLKHIVELPAYERPLDPLRFLRKMWNPWTCNVVATAMKNAIEDMAEELAEERKLHEVLKRTIDEAETALLNAKIAALNASVESRREVKPVEEMNPTDASDEPEGSLACVPFVGLPFDFNPSVPPPNIVMNNFPVPLPFPQFPVAPYMPFAPISHIDCDPQGVMLIPQLF
ncbi:unnamed protein product [Cylicocyclus nassatus]|uniref:Uncharacterized protein n=1 Tax=Cylicocyclus nassatus TaxID=53992 RepID=A0AA36HFW2_CYLNA|nr:unnamed protein product [Cylicocyclus nassatus]